LLHKVTHYHRRIYKSKLICILILWTMKKSWKIILRRNSNDYWKFLWVNQEKKTRKGSETWNFACHMLVGRAGTPKVFLRKTCARGPCKHVGSRQPMRPAWHKCKTWRSDRFQTNSWDSKTMRTRLAHTQGRHTTNTQISLCLQSGPSFSSFRTEITHKWARASMVWL
jgi:hypothetical protein